MFYQNLKHFFILNFTIAPSVDDLCQHFHIVNPHVVKTSFLFRQAAARVRAMELHDDGRYSRSTRTVRATGTSAVFAARWPEGSTAAVFFSGESDTKLIKAPSVQDLLNLSAMMVTFIKNLSYGLTFLFSFIAID